MTKHIHIVEDVVGKRVYKAAWWTLPTGARKITDAEVSSLEMGDLIWMLFWIPQITPPCPNTEYILFSPNRYDGKVSFLSEGKPYVLVPLYVNASGQLLVENGGNWRKQVYLVKKRLDVLSDERKEVSNASQY